MNMKRRSHFRTATVLGGLLVLVMATTAVAQEKLYRLVADHQRVGETSTTADAASGGTVVYTKTFFHPGARTYVSFNAQADTHGGAALLMSCRVSFNFGPFVPCELGSGAADPTVPPQEWSVLNKLPTGSASPNNCDDGGGGTADCHDNTIHKEWCMHNDPGTHTIQLLLATDIAPAFPGDLDHQVFYERATIYIDGSGSGWTGSNSNLKCVAPGDPLPWPLP